jgi:hypothetical protein
LARICERDEGISIDSQKFGNKPNIDQNIVDNQCFGRACMGNKPNRPFIFFWAKASVPVYFFLINEKAELPIHHVVLAVKIKHFPPKMSIYANSNLW